MKTAAVIVLMAVVLAGATTQPASQPGKVTLVVLPFVPAEAKDQKLADRMRFAVSQKLSNDADFGAGPGKRFERVDSVKVDQMISALQIPWAANGGNLPEQEEIAKVIGALEAGQTVAGLVKGRTLTLVLFDGAKESRRASVEIPPDKESPKLAVEKVLGDLFGAQFAHIRDVQADHSNPAVEARFASRPNLVADPGFEDHLAEKKSKDWDAILGPDHYAPPVLSLDEAQKLPEDKVAIVPKSLAGDPAEKDGHSLLLRISKNVAESNGLACISTWIAVEQGKKYRFSCKCFSKGPTTHLFINGYATNPDKYGDKNDPEATRRQYYRAQVAPTKKSAAFELLEMDFTPASLKPGDPKIEWIRVDLYAYLKPGDIFFDDIIVKKLDE